MHDIRGGPLEAAAAAERRRLLVQIEVFCYAVSPNDGSEWRQRIEAEAEHFLDVSAWSVGDIAARISAERIHVAINLNGYTKACAVSWPACLRAARTNVAAVWAEDSG